MTQLTRRRRIIRVSILTLTLLLTACTSHNPLAPLDPVEPLVPAVPSAPSDQIFAGWGPDRTVYSMSSPADRPVLNSITDSPYGDDRNFFHVKPAGKDDSTYDTRVILEAGKKYTGYVYFHNAASPSIDEPITNARLKIQFPLTVDENKRASAILSAANTQPTEVWSSVVLEKAAEEQTYAIRYVEESAVLHTLNQEKQININDLVSDRGALIGCDADGIIGGKTACPDGYVTFDFVVDLMEFEGYIRAAVKNSGEFGSAVQANPGETIQIRLEYRNTGTTRQEDVIVKIDPIPGTTVVADTTKLYNAYFTDGKILSNNILSGINIGHYAPSANSFVVFDVEIRQDGAIECGGRWLYPAGAIRVGNEVERFKGLIIDVGAVC